MLCPKAGITISLLPDFLAARLSGTLAEVEHAIEAADEATSGEAAAEAARPATAPDAVTLPSALRWLRRRLVSVRAALLAAVTLVPALLECPPTLSAVRERLGVSETLVALREVAAAHLGAICVPVGFGPRATRGKRRQKAIPHEAGPDPP